MVKTTAIRRADPAINRLAKEKYSEADIIEALEATGGFVTAAAKMLKITRRTLYRYFERHPALAAKMEDIREERLDISETKLMEKIKAGDLISILFHLKCQGKHRGYIERKEIYDGREKPKNNTASELTDDELAKIINDK